MCDFQQRRRGAAKPGGRGRGIPMGSCPWEYHGNTTTPPCTGRDLEVREGGVVVFPPSWGGGCRGMPMSGVNKSARERRGRQNLSPKVPSKKGSLGVISSPRNHREKEQSKSASFERRHSGGHLLGRPLLFTADIPVFGGGGGRGIPVVLGGKRSARGNTTTPAPWFSRPPSSLLKLNTPWKERLPQHALFVLCAVVECLLGEQQNLL